jgi:hypothetical protein
MKGEHRIEIKGQFAIVKAAAKGRVILPLASMGEAS